MHDSKIVANELLELAKGKGNSLTPMQILKLVYIAHGWSLGLYGRPLIRDEIQAWRYGPVIPRLYNAIKDFRDQPIEGPLKVPAGDMLNDNERDLIGQVYKVYGNLSGISLSRLTHAPGTPWDQTYEPGEFGIRIPNDIIEGHYEQLAKD